MPEPPGGQAGPEGQHRGAAEGPQREDGAAGAGAEGGGGAQEEAPGGGMYCRLVFGHNSIF